MVNIALASLRGRKLRLVMTVLSIVLGVAFVSGTYIFTDSISDAFDSLFVQANAGTDVTIRDRRTSASGLSGGDMAEGPRAAKPHRVPESLLTTVRDVPGIESAEGYVAGSAQLLKRDGTPIGGQGPPTLGFSWVANEKLSSLELVSGRGPQRDGEIAIDVTSASKGHYKVGDTMQVVFPGSDGRFKVVGTVRFGKVNNLQGATLSAFELETAQRVFQTGHGYDLIAASADDGVSASGLARRVRSELPNTFEVQTGEQTTREQLAEVGEGISFFRNAMLVFAAVALFVGAFTIFNTFSILVAQRTREFGLLRAIGASRRQVLGLVTAESVVIGFTASLLGIAAGIGVSFGLRALLGAFDIDLPEGGLVLRQRTLWASLLIGVGVTVVASLVPAIRAARVPPIEALRSGPGKDSRPRRLTSGIGAAVLTLGVALLAAGLFGNQPLRVAGPLIGAGFVVAIIGTAALTPLLVAPIVTVVGAPFRLRGVTGRIASNNARRNPSRTAITASALMIGLGLASFAAIFTASITTTVGEQVDRALGADFVLTNSARGNGLATSIATDLAKSPRIDNAVGISTGWFKVGKEDLRLAAANPAGLGKAVNLEMQSGHSDKLRVGDVLVSDLLASQHDWKAGESFRATFPGGDHHTLRVAGVFADIGLTDFIVSDQTFTEWYPARLHNHSMIMVNAADTLSPAQARSAVKRALRDKPFVKVQDQTDLKNEQQSQTDQLLGLLYGLLGLSLLIALFGIVNTLALSVLERTREIGLLRAVGMTRWQARRMVAAEAVMIAVLGSLLGMVLGLSLGWAAVQAIEGGRLTFAVPQGFVLTLLVVGVVAGLIAAIAPARRAARLDILQAIATE